MIATIDTYSTTDHLFSFELICAFYNDRSAFFAPRQTKTPKRIINLKLLVLAAINIKCSGYLCAPSKKNSPRKWIAFKSIQLQCSTRCERTNSCTAFQEGNRNFWFLIGFACRFFLEFTNLCLVILFIKVLRKRIPTAGEFGIRFFAYSTYFRLD